MKSPIQSFRFALVGLLLGLLLADSSVAFAEERVTYPVSVFVPEYAVDHPELPPLEVLQNLTVTLSRSEISLVEPVPGLAPESVVLGARSATRAFGPSAVVEVGRQIVAALNARGFVGVYVEPHPEDIDLETGRDLRTDGHDSLRMQIWTGRVQKLRSTAAGWRIGDQAGADRPKEAALRAGSPSQPGDLLQRKPLEDYVHRLNRFPRRSVQLALTAGSEPATVNLEYQVYRDRPWSLYAQVSDTGTSTTSETRHRIGLVYHQLTERDDSLRLEYVTGKFSDVHGVVAAYETPVPFVPDLRFSLTGTWHEFRADQLGLPNARFEGRTSQGDARLIWNAYQNGRLFADLEGSFGLQKVKTDNQLAGSGESDFLISLLGARVERFSDTSALLAGFRARRAVGSENGAKLIGLGRTPVDNDSTVFQWNASASAFIEPLLFRDAWKQGSDVTLAHELYLAGRGQHAPSDRLIPQHQQIAGGLHTVRGYPQAAASGDSVHVLGAEYRFHLPRALPLQSKPIEIPVLGDFRVARQRARGRPDWDFVLRGFYDWARTRVNSRQIFEDHETLAGAGVGAEVVLRQNLRGRLDCGWALKDLSSRRTERGDRECYFEATVVF